MLDARQLEASIWRIADGHPSDDDLARFHEDERASLYLLDRMIGEAEEDLAGARRLPEGERDLVVADFSDVLASLKATYVRLRPLPEPADDDEPIHFEELVPEPVRLQATWIDGRVVVWAAGRGSLPEANDGIADRLEACGGPPHGWEVHPGVQLPGSVTAEALSISMKDALGWLVAVGGGQGLVDGDGTPIVGDSVRWMGLVALEGVRLVSSGCIVPQLKSQPTQGRAATAHVRWAPALVDGHAVEALAAAMPGPVVALDNAAPRATTIAVMTAVIETIVGSATSRMELPAPPPTANSQIDLADSVIARMNGSEFTTDATMAMDLGRRLDQWAGLITNPGRPRLVVRLDPPDSGGVWLVSVHAPVGKGKLIPIDAAIRGEHSGRQIGIEWTRLARLYPVLDRAGQRRRGQVALSQDEAWDFMTQRGPSLAAVGFDVRVPQMSRRKATPSLRLFAEGSGSVVGAHQLSAVSWTVAFDDVELTSEEVRRLARQARPLVQSPTGRWIEVDRADLEKAAAALEERENVTHMTGAEILRQSLGLDGSGLAGGVQVFGQSWAMDIVRRAAEAPVAPVLQPEGFAGELRTYQAEAVGWLRFLDASGLGGCLALDMGLGKTPTVLAHLAANSGDGPVLVVAPAAVVGNWAAEAAKFTPGLKVVVHHGADRADEEDFATEITGADMVITTYATAVRDIDAILGIEWSRMVLDEAQAIKNATSDTALELRRVKARTRIALTGTPIENGLGDLWAIMDFTNPGLVGPRASFVAQMSGDGEAALKALNGILLFRRTKTEPEVARELPDKIDELDHCTMTKEQIGLYQAVLDELVVNVGSEESGEPKQGAILAAITALKQICNHPSAYREDNLPLAGRSGKLARLEEICESVFEAGERILIFTHFASWGRRLAEHLTQRFEMPIDCYDGSLARGVRDRMVAEFQEGTGAGAMVLSLKAGGTGLNLTSANHVVLYDRWWNPAVEDQARDRAWRIGQGKTVISHRLVCPGTVDERVEEVVAGKRHIANLVLPKSSSISDLSTEQLRVALGLRPEELLAEELVGGENA
ncbi:MAG TPA: DEAD/DEAH box helicase [Ilumatobacteraceae bacterium]|nr:DEAD/DEAH box helicase [Ilumatobacteraceae bacterium]